MKNGKWMLVACGFAVFALATAGLAGVIAADQGPAYLPFIIKQEAPSPTSMPPGVQVLSNHSSFVDSIGNLHIVGEVLNNTANHLRFVKISVNILDSLGQLLESDFTYTYLETLPASDKTCFDLSVQEPPGWSSYQLMSPTYWTDGQPLPALTVLNDNGSYDPAYGWYKITGQVRNDDTVRVMYVAPVGTLYNADNTVIGCDFAFVNSTHLDPGEISSFKITFSNHVYTGVASYRLQVDGIP